jgi:hypothetical protein
MAIKIMNAVDAGEKKDSFGAIPGITALYVCP